MGSNDLVLAVDNSLDFLNIALGGSAGIVEERHMRVESHSSEVLPLEVESLLDRHRFTAGDISLIAVTLGPGSFTGVRVALAFCKGLSEGLSIPLVGVPTPDVLAHPFAFMEGYYLCPIIDAKKGEVFFTLFHVTGGVINRLEGYQNARPDDLARRLPSPCLCFGTGLPLCRPQLTHLPGVTLLDEGFRRITGEALIFKGLTQAAERSSEGLRPIYGRRSEAEIRFNVTIP
jgi:tRNA threonylcarbamoyladenosine biosynthesis protein TsaB